MTTTTRRAPKPVPPPSPATETEISSQQAYPDLYPADLHCAFLAWQAQHCASHKATTLSDLLTLARSLNNYGLSLRHQLDESDPSGTIRLSARLEHISGSSISSGALPLSVQPAPGEFTQARILTAELVLGIAREFSDATAELTQAAPEQAPEPAPTAAPETQPATPAAAPRDEIEALKLQIQTFPADWITYLRQAFSAQFGIPTDRPIADQIKSAEHVAFLRSIIPPQLLANGQQ